jgi:hypothetical protein
VVTDLAEIFRLGTARVKENLAFHRYLSARHYADKPFQILASEVQEHPKTCRDFPYVAVGTHSLGGRQSSLARWAALCPIIFIALERYKHLTGYHPHSLSSVGVDNQDCPSERAGRSSIARKSRLHLQSRWILQNWARARGF